MPPTPPPRPPERFLCPICGCEAYQKVWVTGRNGRPVETDAWQCLRCTVMFREPMRFSKFRY